MIPTANGGPTPFLTQRLRAVLWLVLAGIAAGAVLRSVEDVREYPGTDLRCRVVGARAWTLGLDPYLMHADPHQAETLQDPDRAEKECTRCTCTPTVLCLYVPLARLPYRAQRYIWCALEWGALAGSILLLRRTIPGRGILDLFTAIAVVFFAGGDFWRLHVERGQYYVFVVFLFSWTAWFCLGTAADGGRVQRDRWWHGIPLGIAAALRLTPLAALPPLWAAGYRRTALGAMITFSLCIAGTLAAGGMGWWQSYCRNMSIHARLGLDPAFATSERAGLPTLPGTAEGINFRHWAPIESADVTFETAVIQPLSEWLGWTAGWERWQLVTRAAAAMVCLLFTLAASRRTLCAAEALAAGFLCVLCVEFFVPTRNSYADILFLAPIALLLPSMLKSRTGYLWLAATVLTLAVCHGLLPLPFAMARLRPPLLMIALLGQLALSRPPRRNPSPQSSLLAHQAPARGPRHN